MADNWSPATDSLLGDFKFSKQGTMDALGGIGGLIGGIGTAGAYGDEASIYRQGAGAAFSQAETTKKLGELQDFQIQRKLALTESTQRAAMARNGLEEAGSAADLIRESVTQGANMRQMTDYSTELKADQFSMQGFAAEAQAKAADDASSGAMFGGILKGISGIASLAMMF